MNLQSPIAKVRGLGSAKQGTHHWWYQRLTAVALVPLTLWVMSSIINATSMGYTDVQNWLTSPLNAALFLAFISALFFHAQLGMQVVIEDYIESEWQKIGCIMLVKFLAVIAGLASALAIIKVFIGI